MKQRVNKIFLQPSSGPRKFCEICKVYYVWNKGTYRCPACGSRGTAQDVLSNTHKVLKADVPQPMIVSRKKSKLKVDPDLPSGAQWTNETTSQF